MTFFIGGYNRNKRNVILKAHKNRYYLKKLADIIYIKLRAKILYFLIVKIIIKGWMQNLGSIQVLTEI